ncbi:MAG: hypothetical protein M3430_05725 [Acidobacteriota bacterium]|nr:hypothetical protein [Acidobacteriota bacterium]
MNETASVKTNAEVRRWYLEQVARIPKLNKQWLEQGLSAQERAEAAWRIRHDARLEARAMMANPAEVELLRQRDIAEYGNSDGPAFEFLVEKLKEAGLEGEAVYEAIINGSYRTNAGVNRSLGI